jgi:hypothetical protein
MNCSCDDPARTAECCTGKNRAVPEIDSNGQAELCNVTLTNSGQWFANPFFRINYEQWPNSSDWDTRRPAIPLYIPIVYLNPEDYEGYWAHEATHGGRTNLIANLEGSKTSSGTTTDETLTMPIMD